MVLAGCAKGCWLGLVDALVDALKYPVVKKLVGMCLVLVDGLAW